MKKTLLIACCIAWGGLGGVASAAVTAPDGAALYASSCVNCHGPLITSDKAGATAGMIQNAINSNFGGMGSLSTLTGADIQAIAAALHMYQPGAAPAPATGTSAAPQQALDATAGPAPQWDGATLYATYCAKCHDALATSTKLGASEAEIQAAISANTGGMGYFSSLTSAQISAIAGALAGDPAASAPVPPSGGGTGDGAALYAANCSGCHGQLAVSSVAGATVSGIQAAIRSNRGGMSRLSALSATDLQAIASALASSSGAAVGGDEGGEAGGGGTGGEGGGHGRHGGGHRGGGEGREGGDD